MWTASRNGNSFAGVTSSGRVSPSSMNDPKRSNSHALRLRAASPRKYSRFQMPVWQVTQYAALRGYSSRSHPSSARNARRPGGFGINRRLAAP